MKKELLKKFDELVEKNLVDYFVDSELKEVFLSSVLDGGFSGWTHHILLNANGLSVTGALGQGSMTMEEYNGNAIRLATMDANVELDGDIVDFDNLEEEEKEELIEKIMLDKDIETKEEVIEDLSTFNIDGYFQEINFERYKEFIQDNAEVEWDNYYRDNLLEKIYDSIAFESEIGVEE